MRTAHTLEDLAYDLAYCYAPPPSEETRIGIEAQIRDFMAQKIQTAVLCCDDQPDVLAAVLSLASALGCPVSQPTEVKERDLR